MAEVDKARREYADASLRERRVPGPPACLPFQGLLRPPGFDLNMTANGTERRPASDRPACAGRCQAAKSCGQFEGNAGARR